MQIPCVYLPGPAPAVTVANISVSSDCNFIQKIIMHIFHILVLLNNNQKNSKVLAFGKVNGRNLNKCRNSFVKQIY
jgi:hypothetical protein